MPGMDSYKEIQIALYGDRFLNRGIAVLAIDGPGQYEAPMLGIYFSHGELGGDRQAVGATGSPSVPRSTSSKHRAAPARASAPSSARILTAHEPRISAFAVISVCHEPGCHTIFQEASPTFKKRFMYMSGITDEAEFDKIPPDA